ncbi:MAG: hypothetical protein ACJ79K_06690 [Gemmatimonadaceae bacterium]
MVIGALLVPVVVRAQHPLASVPFDDPAYEVLDGLVRTGCVVARVSPYRPYLVRDVRAAIAKADSNRACAPALLGALHARFDADTLDLFNDGEGAFGGGAALTVAATQLSNGAFRPLWSGIRPKSEGDPPVAAIARARVSWGSRKVYAVAEGIGYTNRRNDPSNRQRALRNTSGAVDFGESYFNIQVGRPLTFSFGRSSEAWLGEGRESLALSAWGPMLDRIALGARWKRVEARALYGTLSDVELTPAQDSVPGTAGAHFYRYIVAHALTVRPTPAVEFTLGETAILARGTRTLDLAYANPLMAYVVTQNDTARTGPDDNLQVFGALRAQSGGSAVQAELLVDDIQIDATDRKNIQDQLAWSIRGSQSIPLIIPTAAVAEYRHINSYTYLRNRYATAYQTYDQPLGSELGPDADLWRVGGELWPAALVKLSGGAGMWRQGAQRLDQRPGRNANGHGGEPFPSVTPDRPFVQRALLADAAISYLARPLTVTVRAEGAHVQHPANLDAATTSYVRLQIIGTYAYRIP